MAGKWHLFMKMRTQFRRLNFRIVEVGVETPVEVKLLEKEGKETWGQKQVAPADQKEIAMNIDRLVIRFAGSFVLISLLLSQVHSLKWLWFTTFVGANLLQASFTGFCPLAKILKALGFKEGEAFR